MVDRDRLERLLKAATIASNIAFVLTLAVSVWNAFSGYRHWFLQRFRHQPAGTIPHPILRTILFWVTASAWAFFETVRKRAKDQLKSSAS
jgi:uncharacterized membrane protein